MSDIYLNGEFMPLESAKISVLDRGFLFGDSIYEVIPSYGGTFFRVKEHLQRLHQSLQALSIDNPLSESAWMDMLERLIQPSGTNDQSVYLQVSRGVASVRDHAIPHNITPTVFAMSSPIHPVNPDLAKRGIAAITLDDIRWHMCHIKATTLLAAVLLRQQANDEQAVEAILIRDGLAQEGAASNLFIVKNNQIITPALSRDLLPGITRQLVIELARRTGLSLIESDVSEQALLDADEVWLTSSTKEIMPVVELNHAPVGDGLPGNLFRQMAALYRECKDELRAELGKDD